MILLKEVWLFFFFICDWLLTNTEGLHILFSFLYAEVKNYNDISFSLKQENKKMTLSI